MENKYYWVDIESGIKFECSKEYYESMMKNWNDAIPKFNEIKFKIPIIYGTGGEI